MKNFFKKKYPFILIILLFGIFIFYKIIYLPFPFIEMDYLNQENFYKRPENYHYNKPLDSLISNIQSEVLNARKIVYFGEGNLVRSKNNINIKDKKFKAICSETSKVLFHNLKLKNISTRVVWMNGHTVTEVYHPETGWFLVDPYGDIIVQNCFGKYLNLIQIKKEKCFNIIDITPDTGVGTNYKSINYFNSEENVYKKNDLFVVINEQYLYDFHIETKKFKNILNFVFGKNDIGKGKQMLDEDSKKVGNFGVLMLKL